MSQKLFHKLQQSLWLEPHHAEQAGHQFVESLILNCNNKLQDTHYKTLNIKSLSKEFICKNTHNFNIAYIPKPHPVKINQDYEIKSYVYDKNRPFSAQIKRANHEKQLNSRRSPKIISRYQSIYKINRNSGLKKELLNSTSKEKTKTFVELKDDSSFDNFETEQFIANLRKKKIQEQIQNNEKQKFIRSAVLDNETFQRLNKKFVQSMGSKNFYYNHNGQVAQISKVSKAFVKRNEKQKPTILKLNPTTKRKNEKSRRDIVVEFKGKQNCVKKAREQTTLQDDKTILFYKSNYCTYQVVKQKPQQHHQA